ncbi:FAD-dependent oxidoreductase [Providencia sp. R33]|uniref:FAD-dependent oxidoreductase n=1 Tax=Providencia sp. R33 TaxID=2828763 RepID=UPI001C5BB4B4|nr:FAD-dependent oxidoreductase [Providencia sp. R33]QXX81302.1 FAD-dependent oxidoreductase [Providencia sp. R33]
MNSKIISLPRNEPQKKTVDIRKINFVEIYEPDDAKNIQQQASRCLSCGSPFCEWKCPLHNAIPKWLKLAEEGRIIEAAELSHHTNSLPEVCGRVCPQDELCEMACVLNDTFGAVTIGHIERYINDTAFSLGWRPDLSHVTPVNYRVAIVGAGPAGLACADVLARNGVQVTVFDKHSEIGGLLTFGIPTFKLEKRVMIQRREIFTEMGIQFQLNVDIGKDISLNTLKTDYDAIFLGIGTYGAIKGELRRNGAYGCYDALPYLIANTRHLMQLAPLPLEPYINLQGKNVVVLGGGDTAIDCVRTAVRQGASKVACIYRRDKQSMPASLKEINHAIEEGIEFHFNLQATEILLNEAQQVSGISVIRTQNGELKEGRTVVEPIKNSDFTIEADAVIVAFGFHPHKQPWVEENFVQLDSQGHICANRNSRFPFQTSNEKIFAGGDAVRGSDLVVNAIADGRSAAEGILLFLEI